MSFIQAGQKWRHRNTKKLYIVVRTAILKKDGVWYEDEPLVLYENADGVCFARMAGDFFMKFDIYDGT